MTRTQKDLKETIENILKPHFHESNKLCLHSYVHTEIGAEVQFYTICNPRLPFVVQVDLEDECVIGKFYNGLLSQNYEENRIKRFKIDEYRF